MKEEDQGSQVCYLEIWSCAEGNDIRMRLEGGLLGWLAQLSEADLQVLQLLALNVYFLTSVLCDSEKLPIRLANNAGKKLLELHSEH